MGALINSTRGVWSTTESGRAMTKAQIATAHADYTAELRATRREKLKSASGPDEAAGQDLDDGPVTTARDWKEQLLEALLAVPPDQFERLARRLLREAGFVSATVTGKSGDGGIDGIGVYRLSLVSFPVFFQCKRYKGSVGAGAVRDFRGAMAGRGDKVSSSRRATSRPKRSKRPSVKVRRRSISSTEIGSAICSRSTSWECGEPSARSRRSRFCPTSSSGCKQLTTDTACGGKDVRTGLESPRSWHNRRYGRAGSGAASAR